MVPKSRDSGTSLLDFVTSYWVDTAARLEEKGLARCCGSTQSYPSKLESTSDVTRKLSVVIYEDYGRVVLQLSAPDRSRMDFFLRDDDMLENRLNEIRLCTSVLLDIEDPPEG